MATLTLSGWGQIAQIVLTVITFAGIVVSLWCSRRALGEVKADRELRHAPYLSFEQGGWRMDVSFEKRGKAIPGVNPTAVAKHFPNLPDDAESVGLKPVKRDDRVIRPNYGRLKNYGIGPALSVHICWIPEKVWIGLEVFSLDDEKRKEPLYSRGFNTMPSSPSHIPPGATGELTRLPTFIEKDVDKKFTRVDGVLEITCKDVFGRPKKQMQRFLCVTGYKDSPPFFHVTFSDIVEEV